MQISHDQQGSEEFYLHQHRLIHYISYELMIIGTLVSLSYAYKNLWYLVAIIGSGCILVFLNLQYLSRRKNTLLSSHILILIIFLTITAANYLVWGIGAAYSYWFYIIPLLAAASLVGPLGIIFYSTIAFFMILTFAMLSIPPFYTLPPRLLFIIERVNQLFVYLITVTIVIHFMLENRRYENVLHDQNHLLALEKEKLQYMAFFDQLTHLPNRQHFKQNLHEIMKSLDVTNQCITVFFMDLDNLKKINDAYGHEVGDDLLMQAAIRLQNCFNEGHFVARLGGDEFTAIIVHHHDDNMPQRIAKRIIQAFEKPFILENIEYYCSISMGLSNYPKDSQSVKQLMVHADLAMYEAKKIKGSSYIKAEVSPT